MFYKCLKVPKVYDRPVEVEVVLLSENEPLPADRNFGWQRHFVLINNRFSDPSGLNVDLDEEKGHNEA
ncbi:uncharacterized protein BJX67DRAFT_286688 [Aspergillus lucknowensis]|uniref:Uncharacterized protein n=1 Tax=Aspergillus lucknowensis TaxID=176173 RepID=A0ABR4M159_9EURO